MTCVVGLDLSLRAAGMVAVPLDWNLDLGRVARQTVGQDLSRDADDWTRIARVAWVVGQIEDFVRTHRPESVWIEGYPASGRGVYQLAALAELGGAVRVALHALHLDVRTAQQSSARKALLGKLPRRDTKRIVHDSVRSLGATSWTGDEIDALVAANYGLLETGHAGMLSRAA